jgi:hypothetical protein
MVPLQIRFDGQPNENGAAILRFPKLNEGAPYSFGLRVRFENETYRQWDAPNIRWRIKLRPGDRHELMTLTKANGNFTVEGDRLNFIIKAADWQGVKIPKSTNHLEMDYPFAHVVEFLNTQGEVIERFAQGSGFITSDLEF